MAEQILFGVLGISIPIGFYWLYCQVCNKITKHSVYKQSKNLERYECECGISQIYPAAKEKKGKKK